MEDLVEKLRVVVPELLDENGLLPVPSASDDVHSSCWPNGSSMPADRLMADDFTPKVKETLRAHSCRFVRQGKGDHEIWESPVNGRRFMVDRHIG